MLAPGYRITFDGVSKTWFARRLGTADVPVLLELPKSAAWRLQNGASDMRRLIENKQQSAKGIFDPTNHSYVLRNGCSRPISSRNQVCAHTDVT